MINLPKTICNTYEGTTINKLDILPSYIEECECVDNLELFTPVPKVSFTLCPCPVEQEVQRLELIPPIRIVREKTCFVEFIKNMTSTKFCENGPTCIPV